MESQLPASNGWRAANQQRARLAPATPAFSSLDLFSPVRRQILVGLKSAGRATAGDLGRGAFLSAGATRQHLVMLESEGFVEHEIERRGPGRPGHSYRLTARGNELFGQGYVAIASALLGAALAAPPAVREQAIGSIQAWFLPAPGSADPPLAPGVAVSELNRRGFLATMEDDSRAITLTLRHCPILQLAGAFPVVCDAEMNSLKQSLGTESVERVRARRSGDAWCVYRIAYDEGQQAGLPPDLAAGSTLLEASDATPRGS